MGLKEEIGKKQPFDLLEEEAYLNIVRTEEALSATYRKLFKSHGVSEPQYNVLRILRGADAGPDSSTGLPCQEISGQMLTRVPDITRLIDRLLDNELVTRQRIKEDRRVVQIRITQKGLNLLAEMDQPLQKIHREQLGHLTQEELRQLVQLLEKARQCEQSVA